MMMPELSIQATINYAQIDDAYRAGDRGILLPGGTRSTKTISALQWIIIYCLSNTGKDIAICRDTMANLKRTTLRDFEALCYGFKGFPAMYPHLHVNKSDWTCNINGNTIYFFGLKDDPMRVYGFESDIFFINEVVSTYKNTFDQLEQRCREFWILDCNPSEPQSWVYQLPLRFDVREFRTTYKDNPFLGAAQIRKIESYEPTEYNKEQGTADPRKWAIYGQGLVFKGPEIIYPNWTTYTDDDLPEGYDVMLYGLDWGINAPLAVVQIIKNGNDLYVREICYGSGIEMEDLITILKQEEKLAKGNAYLVCDNSEERSIKSLQRAGIKAMKVRKPPGSVLDGIRRIQNMNLKVHQDSVNVQRELNSYKFKVDEKTDTVLDVPEKENDHSMDAIRYPVITFL